MQTACRHPPLQLPLPRRSARRIALRPCAMAAQQQQPGIGQALPHLTSTGCLYLDYNATTPIFPEVSEQWAEFEFECVHHGVFENAIDMAHVIICRSPRRSSHLSCATLAIPAAPTPTAEWCAAATLYSHTRLCQHCCVAARH